MGETCIVTHEVLTLDFRYPGPWVPMSDIFNFFGLRENPFKINPDPRFLYTTQQTQATSADLVYAIQSRKGLILLTGEVGTGKTMLIRRLLDWLTEQNMPTALIFNSHLQPEHLLDFILNDFGVPCASKVKSEKLMALNRWLLERYRAGQTPVLIVDEAQGLDPAALEEIRLLLNFETPREKLLQIVLAGQPELQVKLKRHELRQLRQRITVRCTTAPLTLEQTRGYIRERLRIAGANNSAPIFAPDAVGAIHAYARGIPRVINVLAEQSLINACAESASTVSAGAVEQAAYECQLDRVDSVARIVNTGSYSTTGLSDIAALLGTISADPNSVPEPVQVSQSAVPPPAPSRAVFHVAQPSLTAERVSKPLVCETRLESSATGNEVAGEEAHRNELEPLSPQLLPEPPEVIAPPAHAAVSASRSGPPPLHFLRLWGRSFLADLRASSRRFRHGVRSFDTRRWNPLIRKIRRRAHQASVGASKLLSDPRWKRIPAHAASASRNLWNSFKSATPPWLAQYFSIRQRSAPGRAENSVESRLKRRRAIASLRRWLHEPLTTQQKRTREHQRRSMG
jgi:general secretion pathway protein A